MNPVDFRFLACKVRIDLRFRWTKQNDIARRQIDPLIVYIEMSGTLVDVDDLIIQPPAGALLTVILGLEDLLAAAIDGNRILHILIADDPSFIP